MDERKDRKEHQKCNILIENRKHITISGVEDIDSFDESNFVAITCEGALLVRGADLHINKLNVDTGELVVDGEIDSCTFSDNYGGKHGASLLSRLFK